MATVTVLVHQMKKPEAFRFGLVIQTRFRLRQDVRRGHRRTERAGRGRAHCGIGIRAAGRAAGNFACRVQPDVRRQVVGIADGRPGGEFRFQSELVGRRVNLAEVVDAGIGLGGGTGFHEVRNRDGGQEADDGDDDHDFNQREAGLTDVFHCLHFYVLSWQMRREQHDRRVIMITVLFTSLPVAATM